MFQNLAHQGTSVGAPLTKLGRHATRVPSTNVCDPRATTRLTTLVQKASQIRAIFPAHTNDLWDHNIDHIEIAAPKVGYIASHASHFRLLFS